ncbi:MAG TPA: family 43 glycosylhydrolase, partial [Chthoniobacter sp.]|nr:family 43 glycosylhydrolase [Chthoniobacter sp.]
PRAAGQGESVMTTYCNPLSLPDYPVGKPCRNVIPGEPVKDPKSLWLLGHKEQFRELADVSVLWHDSKWYMYPSVDMAWVSGDGGISWEHHPLNVRDIGYAPTVVRHKGKFLLMASDSAIHVSESPLGPFTPVGKIKLPPGVPAQGDPMLFSDDDGRLYYYWGCTPKSGIYGVELDADQPTQVIGTPKELIPFEPDRYPWQRYGEKNESRDTGWMEGAWMLKRRDTYYLTYSVAGTENRTYCVGAAKGRSPLGPFESQKNNPIQRSTEGLITGTAHGSFVEGANGSLWSFYTVRAGVAHGWERRLGMDPAWIAEDGELHVSPPSSIPMRLTGTTKGAEPAGWTSLNASQPTNASTTAGEHGSRQAVDDDLRTWWQPETHDKKPTLSSSLVTNAMVRAVRIVWRDIGIDTHKGVLPGPYRYKVEVETSTGNWKTILNFSQSGEDLLIDFRECPPTPGIAARLVIVGTPPGITPGVADFTVFGETRRQ